VSIEKRGLWLEVASQVMSGEYGQCVCPANGDDIILVEWLPFVHQPGGEVRVFCPTCGAQNYILVRKRPNWVDDSNIERS
jgi:hypothetical protein